MFKMFVVTLFLVVLLAQFAVSNADAMGDSAGGCAPGFTLEMAMEHDNHHHKHVGTDADQNSHGYTCI